MKILVLGATGFLGRRVCQMLKKRGFEYAETSRSLGVDLTNERETRDLFDRTKPMYVLNCAALIGGVQFGYEHAAEMFRENLKMELNLLEMCRRYEVKRLVNPIGNCAYPGIADIYRESEFWDGPLHDSVLAYGFAKKAFCVGSWAYHKQYGVDVINLIFSNMYGPGDHFDPIRSHAVGGMIQKFVDAVDENLEEVVIWGTGNPVREWLYVDDGAEAMIRALDIPSQDDIINVGIGKGYSIKETAEIIARITGFQGNLVYDTSKLDGAPNKIMDAKRCKEVFQWIPATEYEMGLQAAIESYRELKEKGYR